MPSCPRCTKKLTKNKSENAYYCLYHGFVRNIMSPQMLTIPTYKDLKDYETKNSK